MSYAKKILIISAVFPPEPVVSAMISFDIADSLSKEYDVTVLTPRPSRPLGYIFPTSGISKNFKHNILQSFVCAKSKFIGRLLESYSFGKKTEAHINANSYDVIYSNTWPLIAQFYTVKAAKTKKIPIITHIQDIYPESFVNKIFCFKKIITKFLLPIDKYVVLNSSKVITISQSMKDYLIKSRGIHKNKIDVVYNWQDASKYYVHNFNNHKDNEIVFLYLGSLSHSSSVDILIKAFILADICNSKLIIAGNGTERTRLKSLIENTDMNIEIIDAPSDEVGKIQSCADVLLLPLKKGVGKLALPSKLSAYMFSGKPIIGSLDIDSDVANIIVNADCGWVTKPESPNTLAELMRYVSTIKITELINKGSNGLQFANENFSKGNNLKKLNDIIKSIL